MKFTSWFLTTIFIVFGLIVKVNGQGVDKETIYSNSVGLAAHKGFVVPQYEHGLHLTYGRPVALELFFSQQTMGKKERERIYGFPQTGFSVTIIDTDMNETGTIINMASYIDFFIYKSSQINAFIRLGAGFTFASKIYNRNENNLNNILSARISYHALLRAGFEIPVGPQYYILPAISWSHTSNGSFSLPNNGINIASASLGGGYRFGLKRRSAPDEFVPATVDRGFGINLMFSASGKETEPLGSPKRLYYTFRVSVDKTLNKVSRIYAGIEAFHNRGLIDVIAAEPGVDPETGLSARWSFRGARIDGIESEFS